MKMAVHVYECPACKHVAEVTEPAHHTSKLKCSHDVKGKPCGKIMKLSAAVATGYPVLKRGVGGFHRPSSE